MAETIANPPKRRRADDERAPAQPSGVYLRRQRSPETGLLLLYPLSRRALLGSDDTRVEHQFLDAAVPPIGIGISFPASNRAQSVSYVVNNIYAADDGDDRSEEHTYELPSLMRISYPVFCL